MPGRLKIRVIAGRHLPVMDRASDLTDAFVEVKFGSTTYKTEVYPKSLNPMWNSPWYKFEVDDEHLQDELLQVRVLDHDTYSAHDAIGKVNIDIDPMLDPESKSTLYGWFPIYDTMHGIRGEILLQVKLELFADSNQFRQSSCGFKFICGKSVPSCYKITAIRGFVHELLVREDPEYKWIDKLRTPRASNESRQRLFSKMSGELQRHIGRKVENIGGNAVVGFEQAFDLEGESGIVVRGIGTAVTIDSLKEITNPKISPKKLQRLSLYAPSLDSSLDEEIAPLHRSFHEESFREISNQRPPAPILASLYRNSIKDFPFLTLRSYPPNFLTRISIAVTSHSVKYLDGTAESETRESWWNELRQEIRGHCFSLGCNAVVGYTEKTSICDDVIVLSAQGTAAVVAFSSLEETPPKLVQDDHNSDEMEEEAKSETFKSEDSPSKGAELFRAPFQLSEQTSPMCFRASPLNRDVLVPEVLLSTIDPPPEALACGKPALIQARYCRSKKKGQGESDAAHVSEILPFVEYELHKQLYNKLKLHCMNALFGLESSITVGENLIVGVATGTALYLEALPRPANLDPGAQRTSNYSRRASVDRKCAEFADMCRETFQIYPTVVPDEGEKDDLTPCKSTTGFDLSLDGKKSLAIGIEDADDDDELLSYIQDQLPPHHCFASSIDSCPGFQEDSEYLSQTFNLLRRVRYRDDADDASLNRGLRVTCQEALAGLWFRLLMGNPQCHVRCLRFHLVLPDDDELQIWISGSAVIPLSDKNNHQQQQPLEGVTAHGSKNSPGKKSPSNSSPDHNKNKNNSPRQRRDSVDSYQEPSKPSDSPLLRLARSASRRFMRSTSLSGRFRSESASQYRMRHYSDGAAPQPAPSDRLADSAIVSDAQTHVSVVPMTSLPGHDVTRHVGILNMFVIRETTQVRGSDDEIALGEPASGTGCSWFVTRALAESNALIRAHVVAIGGNALTSYRSSYRALKESQTKNEAQILLHVTGDVVVAKAREV